MQECEYSAWGGAVWAEVWRGEGRGEAEAHSTYRIKRAASAPNATFWLLQCEHQYAPNLQGGSMPLTEGLARIF